MTSWSIFSSMPFLTISRLKSDFGPALLTASSVSETMNSFMLIWV
jgi:hypothetical protein